jgi:RND family efflux transporter MFP subunit
LDSAESAEAVDYILEANRIVETVIVRHERDDEETIYPRVSRFLSDDHGLSAMSRAHREIVHQARLLGRLSEGLRPNEAEPYLIRDAQRIIETLESLVHIHNAQEEDIYEHAAAQLGREAHGKRSGKRIAKKGRGATAFEQALAGASEGRLRWSIPASALIVMAIAGGAVYMGGQYFSRVTHGPTPAESALAAVTATAKISAVTATPIDAKTSGAIEAVYCDVDAFVKKGQLCAKIDPRPYQLMVAQDKAAHGLANDRLEKAKSQLAQAHATYERNQNLASRRADAKKVLEAAQKVLEKKQAQVMHDETSVAMARGALRAAEINLEHTDIIAPIDGTVVSRTAEVGKEVTIGKAEPLFIVVPDLGVVIITVRVDQKLADGIRPGDDVSFRLELLPDHSFQGVVTQISLAPRIIDGAANYDLIISAPNPDLLLKPGVLSTVEMTIGPARAFRRPTK